jgi:methylated-DNA-[protein]-cysteine S-methyltransferase
MHYNAIINSPIGKLGIICSPVALKRVDFVSSSLANIPPQTMIAKQVVTQLNAYFKNPLFKFTVPFELEGTVFQQTVWQQMQRIPVGKTRFYGELAQELGSSARAIGGACRRNPVPIVIPCHRVVAAQGLGGFAGDTSGLLIQIKKWLLEHESHLLPCFKH